MYLGKQRYVLERSAALGRANQRSPRSRAQGTPGRGGETRRAGDRGPRHGRDAAMVMQSMEMVRRIADEISRPTS